MSIPRPRDPRKSRTPIPPDVCRLLGQIGSVARLRHADLSLAHALSVMVAFRCQAELRRRGRSPRVVVMPSEL